MTWGLRTHSRARTLSAQLCKVATCFGHSIRYYYSSAFSRDPLKHMSLRHSVFLWQVFYVGRSHGFPIQSQPFPLIYPAVFFAALIGGAYPGAFAAMAGGFVGWWIFIPQRYGLFLLKSGQEFNLAAYLFASMLIVWGADRLRALTKQVENAERLRKLAVEELAHRLKNKLATLQAIVSHQLQEHPRIRDDILGRLNALSVTDGLIIAAQGQGAHLKDILSAELGPYDASRISTEGPDTFLSPKLALVMALLFHELATNAAKYGAFSNPTGRLSVDWSVSDAQLSLKWHESGGPTVPAPSRRGFGTRLLSGALDQCGGNLEMAFEPIGLVCAINLNLKQDTLNLVAETDGPKAFPKANRAPLVF